MVDRSLNQHPHWLQTVAFFLIKILPIAFAGMSIFLGYKLFILGVTGEASIVIDAKGIRGQLINAAPGLIFAIGGVVVLIVAIRKGGKMRFTARSERIDTPPDR